MAIASISSDGAQRGCRAAAPTAKRQQVSACASWRPRPGAGRAGCAPSSISRRRRARAPSAAIVRDHDQRHAAGVELLQQAHHLVAGGAVEVAGRLVGQHQGRLHDGGAGDGHALALAAGELVGPVLGAVGQAEVVERAAHALRRARAAACRPASSAARCSRRRVSRGTRWKLWNTKPMRSAAHARLLVGATAWSRRGLPAGSGRHRAGRAGRAC